MAKKKNLESEETLEEALVGVLEESEEIEAAVVAPVESDPAGIDPVSWLLAQVDAGRGPIGILTGHSRTARGAILQLDAACGDRPRTLSLDRARLGVAGVEVRAYSASEQLRGARLGAAWVQSGAPARLVDLLRRCLQKGAKVFPD